LSWYLETTKNINSSSFDLEKPTENRWSVKVYTSDLNGRGLEGTDANVYISIIESNAESDRIWLTKKNVMSTSKKMFETGQVDEFVVRPSMRIDSIRKIRIGHDNKGLAAGWHLDKVEMTNLGDPSQVSVFECNRWLSKDEEDGQTEVILQSKNADGNQKSSSRLEVEIIHDIETDSEASLPIFSASSNDSKNGRTITIF
jgi:hypothetical protein